MTQMMVPTYVPTISYLDGQHRKFHRAHSKIQKNPRLRVEFIQRIIKSFWRRWQRDVFPTLIPIKRWHTEQRNVRKDDIFVVGIEHANRGKWTISRVLEVFPGKDNNVRNVRVKTPTGLYHHPTYTHQNLQRSSCHPWHLRKANPYGKAHRIRRICSDKKKFRTRSEE